MSNCNVPSGSLESIVSLIRRLGPDDAEAAMAIRILEDSIRKSNIKYLSPSVDKAMIAKFHSALKDKFKDDWFVVDDISGTKIVPHWATKNGGVENTRIGLILAAMKKLGLVESEPRPGRSMNWRAV